MNDMHGRTYALPPRYGDADLKKIDARLAKYAREVKLTGQSLFVWGSVGTGKTFALYAMAKHIVEDRNGPARVYNFAEVIRDTKDDFDRPYGEKNKSAEKLRTFEGIVMIDDVGAEKPTEWVIETMYAIVNWRYERKLPTVITSNCSLPEIGQMYGDRIASRIVEMCGGSDGIVKLTGEDRRTV